MSSQELVVIDKAVVDAAAKHEAIEEMRTVRLTLNSATAQQALKAALYAEALGAAAKTQRAYEVFVEASETQIRAERRLGELFAKKDPALESYEIAGTKRGSLVALSEIPLDFFDRAVRFFLDRGVGCSHSHVIRKAREISLDKVEPGIGRDYEGSLWIVVRNRLRNTHSESLDDARAELRAENGMRRKWDRSERAQKVDALHADARKLAQSITLVRGPERNRDVNKVLEEAELLQAQVAEKLFIAWRLIQSSQKTRTKPERIAWETDIRTAKETAEKLEQAIFTEKNA